MRRAAIFSAVLHIVILMLVFFGLPNLFRKKIAEEQVITVDMLPVQSITNVKTQTKATEEKKPEPPKPEEKKSPPPPPEPKKEEQKPEPTKEKEPEPDLKKEAEALEVLKKKEAEEKKEEEKKAEEEKKREIEEEKKKKEKERKKLDKSFDKILNNLDDKNKKDETSKDFDKLEKALSENNAKQTTKGNDNYDPTKPLSASEMDAIRQQVSKHWNIPAGGKDVKDMKVTIRVKLDAGGNVISASIVDTSRYNASDQVFVSFAESAVRAVKASSPFQNLPQDKYGTWKEFELNFNPKDIY